MARYQEARFQDEKPRLLFQAAVDRRVYWRRLRWALVALVTSGAVGFMLGLPLVQNGVREVTIVPGWVSLLVLDGGWLVALLVMLFSAARAAINLVRALRRRTERLKFFDQGFVWERKGDLPAKYGWSAVKSYVENPRDIRFRKKPLLQWGSVTITMRDGETFKLTGVHGDVRRFAARVRPLIGSAVGTRMGQMLRAHKPFRIHPQITVAPGGLVLDGKQQIDWRHLHAQVKNKKLVLSYLEDSGKLRPVKTVPAHQVENLPAFMELVETTTENFQRPNPYA